MLLKGFALQKIVKNSYYQK